MFIKNLKILNLRNHINSYYNLEKEVLFTGLNGAGKTTILESIFILFGLRSFKKQSFSSAISFNESYFRIESEIINNDLESSVVLLYNGKRTSLINGEEVDDISTYLYSYPVGCYTPDYLGILSKDKQERRNFIDRFIFYTDKSYLEDIKIYNRLIQQKNYEFEKDNPDLIYIDVINEKIVSLSKKINLKRNNIIEKVNKYLSEIYKNLNFEMENVYIKYLSNIEDESILLREKSSRKVLYGIHRDKIEMDLHGRIIEKFSSTGQKKTFILLSLYSFIKYVEEVRGIEVLSLLDDFEAALDINRSRFLKDLFSNGRQVIYTGVDNSRLEFKNVIELN